MHSGRNSLRMMPKTAPKLIYSSFFPNTAKCEVFIDRAIAYTVPSIRITNFIHFATFTRNVRVITSLARGLESGRGTPRRPSPFFVILWLIWHHWPKWCLTHFFVVLHYFCLHKCQNRRKIMQVISYKI